ncbi:hypothetical protein ACTFIV_007356 [Dictyostelium citrinum]
MVHDNPFQINNYNNSDNSNNNNNNNNRYNPFFQQQSPFLNPKDNIIISHNNNQILTPQQQYTLQQQYLQQYQQHQIFLQQQQQQQQKHQLQNQQQQQQSQQNYQTMNFTQSPTNNSKKKRTHDDSEQTSPTFTSPPFNGFTSSSSSSSSSSSIDQNNNSNNNNKRLHLNNENNSFININEQINENFSENIKKSLLEKGWRSRLQGEFEKDYFKALMQYLDQEKESGIMISPPTNQIFRCFNATPFDSVKIVILGQDPPSSSNQANGLAYSVDTTITNQLPATLTNIYKELSNDCGVCNATTHGNLEKWAQQGVLLLNNSLTIKKGSSESHANRGWDRFTDQALSALATERKGIIFFLWGKHAQEKIHLIKGGDKNTNKENHHTILTASHPSPFSVSKGFFGCRHFSTANNILIQSQQSPIDWDLDNVDCNNNNINNIDNNKNKKYNLNVDFNNNNNNNLNNNSNNIDNKENNGNNNNNEENEKVKNDQDQISVNKDKINSKSIDNENQ